MRKGSRLRLFFFPHPRKNSCEVMAGGVQRLVAMKSISASSLKISFVLAATLGVASSLSAQTSPPAVNSSTPLSPAFVRSNAGSVTLSATQPPIIGWRINSGTLPSGLTFNTNTGVISGTPTGSGTSTNNINVGARNSKGWGPGRALQVIVLANTNTPAPSPTPTATPRPSPSPAPSATPTSNQ